ncbi:GNAT family N-acetyltransferase [Lacibacterium aquatile]|uniref:GNAT family N-acetyltransferase n=1 Tax=Lacibacterium aquatile TaxID=1168082 RepID=A0ABW5DQK6_9PROT
MSFTIRRLDPTDLPAVRALRLEALQAHPTAFGASYDTESKEELESYYRRLGNLIYVGGYVGDELVGISALMPLPPGNSAHITKLVSVYIQEKARGTGMSSAMIQTLIGIASRLKFEQIILTVEAGNSHASMLYERLGFVAYGRHPKSLKIAGRYYDELLMHLDLVAAGA